MESELSQRRTANLPLRHGFTLISSLVVIAIVAILAAILFPGVCAGACQSPSDQVVPATCASTRLGARDVCAGLGGVSAFLV